MTATMTGAPVEGHGLNVRMRTCCWIAALLHAWFARTWLLDPPSRSQSRGLRVLRDVCRHFNRGNPMHPWGWLFLAVAITITVGLLRRSSLATGVGLLFGVFAFTVYGWGVTAAVEHDNLTSRSGEGLIWVIVIMHALGAYAVLPPPRARRSRA